MDATSLFDGWDWTLEGDTIKYDRCVGMMEAEKRLGLLCGGQLRL
jgi:hypothetical protein